MTKLHDRVFLTDADDLESDTLLSERLQHLRFVTVEHLSISPELCTAYPWESAQQELCKMATCARARVTPGPRAAPRRPRRGPADTRLPRPPSAPPGSAGTARRATSWCACSTAASGSTRLSQ